MAIQEVANKMDLLGQTGSIGTATLFNVGPVGAGMYVAFISVLCTTVGSAGTVSVGLTWNNGVTSGGFDSAAFSLTTTGEQSALLGNFYSIARSPITFYNTVTCAGGS